MRFISIVTIGLSLSGCSIAHLDSRGIAYATDTSVTSGSVSQTSSKAQRLFIWKSNYSAGIGTDEGICVQGALTGVANATEATGKVGRAPLDTPLEGAKINDLGNASLRQSQSLTLLNATNGQTAFANIALFYLCQISLNRSLDPETIAKMWATTHQSLEKISATNAGTMSISASIPSPAQPSTTAITP